MYTNAQSMGNKQGDPEANTEQGNYDRDAIMTGAAIDGYRLCRQGRQRRMMGWLHVLGSIQTALISVMVMVQFLWVGIREKAKGRQMNYSISNWEKSHDC